RRCAQPISVIVWPRSASLTRPQYVVLIRSLHAFLSGRHREAALRGRFGCVGRSGGLSAGRGAQPGRFRTATAGRSMRVGGATTPIEITYLSASSTLIESAMTSLRGSIRKKPEVGFGVVGTYT